MSYAFSETLWPERLPIENWDTSNVVNMDGMFYVIDHIQTNNCYPLILPMMYPDFTNWNFQSIQSCRQFFFWDPTCPHWPNNTVQDWNIISFLQYTLPGICNWMETIN